MKVFERYFERHKVEHPVEFPNDPEVIVIIPVLDDVEIFATLASLDACSTEAGALGVIVLVNHGENSSVRIKQSNRLLLERLESYTFSGKGDKSVVVRGAFDLPARTAGVGLARKLAMDMAADWFYRHGKPGQVIASLDADTLVETNYTDAIVHFFKQHPVAGVSIDYAHRLEEAGEDEAWRQAMVKYELYLRYYSLALAYTGHPYAYTCIGSAFAVRASDYAAQGGMNKRQAGEDFYFLQKLMATGRYANLNETRVYPSARFSARTPFGTGRSVQQIVEQGGSFRVYHWEAFRELKCFFDGLPALFGAGTEKTRAYFAGQTPALAEYLTQNGGVEMVSEANGNCASEEQFVKRFFHHFDAFRVLKYLNYVHERVLTKMEIDEAVKGLLPELGLPADRDCMENLQLLRQWAIRGKSVAECRKRNVSLQRNI